MHIEYEEFDTIDDVFMYMASAAPPMKNTMPVNSYKGYVMSFIPLSGSNGDMLLQNLSKRLSLLRGQIRFILFP